MNGRKVYAIVGSRNLAQAVLLKMMRYRSELEKTPTRSRRPAARRRLRELHELL